MEKKTNIHNKQGANRTQLLPGRICTLWLLLEPNVPHWYSKGQTGTMVRSTGVCHPSPSPFHFGEAAKRFEYMSAVLAASGSNTQTHKCTQISYHRVECTMSLVHRSSSLADTVDLRGLAEIPEQNIATCSPPVSRDPLMCVIAWRNSSGLMFSQYLPWKLNQIWGLKLNYTVVCSIFHL